MISVEQLTVSYQKDKNVIESLDLILQEEMIHGIVGLNGSGKTTLLNSIYGLLKPGSGRIMLNGNPVSKKDISYLPTENFFYSNITGYEYLSLFKNTEFDVDDWNKLFLLPLDTIIDTYSTGMKKKLALLGVLKQNKPVLILDEPFNGLDIEAYQVIKTILLQFKKKGKTILITSHIMETLTGICDYIHHLHKGKIVKSIAHDKFDDFQREISDTIENKNSELISMLLK